MNFVLKPPHFLLAPDSFKGALCATRVCAAMENGIQRVFDSRSVATERAHRITRVPLADGGEGTVDAFFHGAGGVSQSVSVRGPLGENVDARWLRLSDGRAVIEMAQSCGLTLVPEDRRDALRASSFGLGETVRAALDCGCRELLIGVGGSATTDGGAGALQALGARFLDARGQELPSGGAALSQLSHIEVSSLDARLRETQIQVLCDVTNPLCGARGAARVFGPQKGASPKEVETLDAALSHFADVASSAFASTRGAGKNEKTRARSLQVESGYENRDDNELSRAASTRDTTSDDLRDVPGAGAAGGAAFGLMRFCNATLVSGIDAILDATRFSEKLEAADLVLTGEGSIDSQTPHGKALAGVARAAKNANVPVVAFGGRVKLSGEELQKMGIVAAFPIADGPLSLEESMARAGELLESATERAVRLWLAGMR